MRTPLVLHFEGKGFSRQRLSVRELVSYVSHLQTAIDRVALIRQGGTESVLKGRRPGDIESLCALDVVSLAGGGSVTVVCDLPHLPQTRLPGYEDIGAEALETLVDGLAYLEGPGDQLPRGFDKGVLMALREFGKPLDDIEGRVSISLNIRGRDLERAYTPRTYSQIVRRIRLPVKNRREVEGRLLMADFKETGLRCRIHPPAGAPIVCDFDETQRESILSAMTHYVRVIGEATEIEDQVKALRLEDIEILDSNVVSGLPVPGVPTGFGDLPLLSDIVGAAGAQPIRDLDSMQVDFWPKEESVKDFLGALRRWRRERSEDIPT